MNDNTVAFIGAGNMASCIIRGMVKHGYPAQHIIASNPSSEKLQILAAECGIQTTQDNIIALQQADVIVLAVKPQLMAQICQQIKQHAPESCEKLFVTVAAGLPVAWYQAELGNIRLIRSMPNTPAAIGLGVTGLFASGCSNYERAFVDGIFAGTGQTVWLEHEAQIDHIIATTGSAPAYFFYFMQAMQQVAMELGFDEQQARAMVCQTALGAASMAQQSDVSFEALRLQVTSKGGTTHEAIERFRQHNLEKIVHDAMHAAIARAQDMAKQL
jgi:pyrroline-5-carboxylate reductase